MNGNLWGAGVVLGVLVLVAAPERADAQYNCAVNIELEGKSILRGQIQDERRPSTKQLWQILQTLSFSGQELAEKDGAAILKGDLRVVIDGAGQVQVNELRLVRNKYNAKAWVIAPEDMARILKLRND